MPPQLTAIYSKVWSTAIERLGVGICKGVMEQGFQPEFTIADAGAGLRAGQKAVLPDIPCHGDVFHLQQQFETVVNILNRQSALRYV